MQGNSCICGLDTVTFSMYHNLYINTEQQIIQNNHFRFTLQSQLFVLSKIFHAGISTNLVDIEQSRPRFQPGQTKSHDASLTLQRIPPQRRPKEVITLMPLPSFTSSTTGPFVVSLSGLADLSLASHSRLKRHREGK